MHDVLAIGDRYYYRARPIRLRVGDMKSYLDRTWVLR